MIWLWWPDNLSQNRYKLDDAVLLKMGLFSSFFLNPINLDLKIHFKLDLEWSEHSFIVKDAKKSYWGSLILSNFVFWTIKEHFDHSKTILKWNCRSKFMGFKKKFEKRPILSKSIWKIVKLHRQYMYGSQQLTRGTTFQAVDNGGDRNYHFLGFARISKFFGCMSSVADLPDFYIFRWTCSFDIKLCHGVSIDQK